MGDSGPAPEGVRAPALPSHWPADWSVDPRWFEDDAFWHAVRPALFQPDRWRQAETEVVQALALLGVSPPDAILDVACGPGRHLIPLAEFGYQATGLDRTREYLEEATSKARQRGLTIQTVLGNVFKSSGFHGFADFTAAGPTDRSSASNASAMSDEGLFAGAIWLDSSIGYGPRADDLQALRSVRQELRPGGRLVLETLALVSPLEDRGDPAGEEVEEQLVGGRTWVLQRRITKSGWMEVRWGPDAGEPLHYRHRLYSAAELLHMLNEAGFCKPLLYNTLAGDSYQDDSPELVIVAERGDSTREPGSIRDRRPGALRSP